MDLAAECTRGSAITPLFFDKHPDCGEFIEWALSGKNAADAPDNPTTEERLKLREQRQNRAKAITLACNQCARDEYATGSTWAVAQLQAAFDVELAGLEDKQRTKRRREGPWARNQTNAQTSLTNREDESVASAIGWFLLLGLYCAISVITVVGAAYVLVHFILKYW